MAEDLKSPISAQLLRGQPLGAHSIKSLNYRTCLSLSFRICLAMAKPGAAWPHNAGDSKRAPAMLFELFRKVRASLKFLKDFVNLNTTENPKQKIQHLDFGGVKASF